METACGAGIEVPEEEIKDAVNALIEKNKEALMTQRYCFPISQLMYVMKEGRMKWADGKKMREIFDAAILALLGPKTAADTAAAALKTAEKDIADAKAAKADADAKAKTLKAANDRLAKADAKLADAKTRLTDATAAVKAAAARLDQARKALADALAGRNTGSTTGDAAGSTTTTVSTPASADVANKAAVKTNKSAQLGSTGVDTAEVMVFAMALTAAAGATMELRRRGQGRYDVMARHAR